MCLNSSTFFRYSASSPHRATKPSRGWLRVGGRKPRFVLSNADPTRNKVTAKERTGVLGCGKLQLEAVSWSPEKKRAGQKKSTSEALIAPGKRQPSHSTASFVRKVTLQLETEILRKAIAGEGGAYEAPLAVLREASPSSTSRWAIGLQQTRRCSIILSQRAH